MRFPCQFIINDSSQKFHLTDTREAFIIYVYIYFDIWFPDSFEDNKTWFVNIQG